jgi:hypothetical protein
MVFDELTNLVAGEAEGLVELLAVSFEKKLNHSVRF